MPFFLSLLCSIQFQLKVPFKLAQFQVGLIVPIALTLFWTRSIAWSIGANYVVRSVYQLSAPPINCAITRRCSTKEQQIQGIARSKCIDPPSLRSHLAVDHCRSSLFIIDHQPTEWHHHTSGYRCNRATKSSVRDSAFGFCGILLLLIGPLAKWQWQ